MSKSRQATDFGYFEYDDETEEYTYFDDDNRPTDEDGNRIDKDGNIIELSEKNKAEQELIEIEQERLCEENERLQHEMLEAYEKGDIKGYKKTVVTVRESPKVTTTTTIETITTSEQKKEKILPEGQKDLEGNEASNIRFGDLVTRNIMLTTHSMLKTHLILFPSFGFKNEISGMILYGPNGTGKTEYCSKLMLLKDYTKHCDFEFVDIYHLIDSEMGETSKKVADKFKEWTDVYKKKNRIQVKIIDEGEMVFLHKKDKGSKAYSELSNSMLKHTGKFNGVFLIIITNDRDLLNKGAISRFESVYWPPLDNLERNDFMKNKFEKSEIKVDMKDFDKIEPYLEHLHFGDIRTHNKLMSHIKGWYVQNHKKGDMIKIEELIPLFVEFDEKIKKDIEETEKNEKSNRGNYKSLGEIISPPGDNFVYPEEEEMIDYCINNCNPRFKTNYLKLKQDYEMLGLRGNQLEGFLKPSYKTIKERGKK